MSCYKSGEEVRVFYSAYHAQEKTVRSPGRLRLKFVNFTITVKHYVFS